MTGYTPTSGLPEGTTSGRTNVEVETIYVFHATVPVYYPAPDGATYCNSATCIHNHADSDRGRADAEDCAERLRKIVATGRLPKWAHLNQPLPS